MRFDAKEFGGRIRNLRKKKGLTQEQLSIMLNGDAPHNNHLRERLTFLAQELEKITADLPVWG